MAGRNPAEIFPKTTASIGKIVLEARNLTCTRGGVYDISLSVRRGEILGIAGLVGASRTEFARTLFGLTPADSGEILVDAKPVHHVRIRSIAHRLAHVSGDSKAHGVIEDLPITENISIALLRSLNDAWLVIAVIGMTIVIVAAQFDISIGSVFAVCGALAGLAAKAGLPMPLVLLIV
jgi:rhamnose transport system ATP-binding protein